MGVEVLVRVLTLALAPGVGAPERVDGQQPMTVGRAVAVRSDVGRQRHRRGLPVAAWRVASEKVGQPNGALCAPQQASAQEKPVNERQTKQNKTGHGQKSPIT